MAAEVLAAGGAEVQVVDAMRSVGRKFLLAGKGGLNLTHAQSFDAFVARFGERRQEVGAMLGHFGPQQLRDWAAGLGIETFVGSSGRVFPRDMKAAPLLRAWLQRLRAMGVTYHMRHRWVGWTSGGALRFETPLGEVLLQPDVLVLGLGGASWSRLGSDGAWVDGLRQRGVAVAPLRPSNCGFERAWSEHFATRHAGQALKSVAIALPGTSWRQVGEFVVTHYGIEGSLVYAASAPLREAIEAHGLATLYLDK